MSAVRVVTTDPRDAIYFAYLRDGLDRDEAIRRLTKTGLTQKGAANRLASSVLPSRHDAGIGLNGFEHEVVTYYLPAVLATLHQILAKLREIAAKLPERGAS